MLKGKWLGALTLSVMMLSTLSGMSQAADAAATSKAAAEKTSEVSEPVSEAIRAGIKRVAPGLLSEKISTTPVAGVFEVVMHSGEILYITGDGSYVFGGDLMKVEDGGLDNLTEKVRARQVKSALVKVDVKDMIVFPAVGEKKATMYVFTDVDCGYCRKLHQEVSDLNKAGVEVRYLAFPRGGQRAPAFAKMVSAWCAADRNQAMNTLKNGGSIPPQTCDNPVQKQYELGLALNVRGTPAIFLEDGRSVPGYQPAPALLKLMGVAPDANSPDADKK